MVPGNDSGPPEARWQSSVPGDVKGAVGLESKSSGSKGSVAYLAYPPTLQLSALSGLTKDLVGIIIENQTCQSSSRSVISIL